MTFKKVGSMWNYGYGRSPNFAAKCAILDRYGSGRFSTRYTLESRINDFIAFMRTQWVSRFEGVDKTLVLEYAESLRVKVLAGDLNVGTAHNYLSAVNCVMETMRGNTAVWVSPREAFGARLFVRQDVPETLDYSVVEAAALHLESNGEERVAGVLRLCRVLGLRFREASLLDVRQALKEAKRSGNVTIARGTKGGRPRLVHAGNDAIEVLRRLAFVLSGESNIIPQAWQFKKWSSFCYRTWRRYANDLGITSTFKEFRAAFACRLYEKEAGVSAPVVTGGRTADRELDLRARTQVALALGHSRTQIASSYVGTSVRAKE